MAKTPELTKNLVEHCRRVGISSLLAWFKDNDVSLSASKSENLYDSIALTISEGNLSEAQLLQGIAEIEENSDKKIFLMITEDYETLVNEKKRILRDLLKQGMPISKENWQVGTPKKSPTFVYLFWDDDILKIKFIEQHFEVDPDYDNDKMTYTPKIVNIIFILDLNNGWVQLRLDTAGMIHQHKGDNGKPSESAYENYYKDLFRTLFPDVTLVDMKLAGIANYIAIHERDKFRLTKGVSTVSNNAKQTFASSSSKFDVRDLPEYEGAAATGSDSWLTEDLTGYWTAKTSKGELKKDLFMRISRRISQVRVQRGCLEKELNYGIEQIREIQNTI